MVFKLLSDELLVKIGIDKGNSLSKKDTYPNLKRKTRTNVNNKLIKLKYTSSSDHVSTLWSLVSKKLKCRNGQGANKGAR